MQRSVEDDRDSLVIPPRIRPRDIADILIGLPIGIFQAAVCCGVPAFLAFLLSRSLLIAFLIGLLLYGAASLFIVRRLIIASDGLHFKRALGSPKFLSWDRVRDISPASRSEVVLRSWLWPIFFTREATACLSALGHYRITWDTGYCYFPPIHRKEFEEYVAARLQSRNV
jgi:hypothetical protein